MKKYFVSSAFIIGFGLLAFIFLTVSLTALSFLAGGKVAIIWPILSLIIGGALVYKLSQKEKVPRPYVGLLIYFGLILGSVIFSSLTIDPSWDGNTYHKTAIGELKNGWNPIRQDINTFNKSAENPFKIIGEKGLDRAYDTLWIDHYPKGSWIFAASLYKITGNIESGKALAPLSIAILFLFAFGYLYRKLGTNKSIVLGLLLAFNPIALAQVYSYYVDGIMGNLLICLLIMMTILIEKKTKLPRGQLVLYTVIGVLITLIVNLKFTGLVYSGIIVLCYGAYLLITRQWTFIRHLLLVGCIVVVSGFLLVGATSYIKNTVTNGNPLYPLIGKNKVDFIAIEMPAGYEHMSRLRQFVQSNLGPTMQLNHEESLKTGDPVPKIPFSATIDEIRLLRSVDIRHGGYGVWFGGILIVSSLAALFIVMKYRERYKREIILFALPLLSILISIMAVDATWWARYLPQLIIYPIVIAMGLYLLRKAAVANVLVAILFFNAALMTVVGSNAQTELRQTLSASFAKSLPCNQKTPTKVFSSARVDGELYNVQDKCHTIQLLTPEEFKMTTENSRTELINGIYVIHD